jgi:sterol 14-demethylase
MTLLVTRMHARDGTCNRTNHRESRSLTHRPVHLRPSFSAVQCGDIFRIRLFHQNITMMVGPKAQQFFFAATDQQLSQKEVYTFTVPVFGRNIVYDAPTKVMQQQLKFVHKGLNQINMAAHCAKIVREAEEYFAVLPNEGEMDLMQFLSELIILTASRCLLGQEIRETVQAEFAELYQDLSDGMNHLTFFWANAPTERHRKRDAARAKIANIFGKVIRDRRATGAQHDDFLQVLVDAEYTDGSQAKEDEIVGLLLAALFAGQHTSNITSTWLGLSVLQRDQQGTNPNGALLPKILKEQEEVMKKYNNEINLDSLAEMDVLHNCVKETLRMYPPLIVLMRKCLEPMTYTTKAGKEVVIPKGDIVAVSPPVGHRLEDVFTNPLEFEPERFMEGREEDLKEKNSFLAFGGGRHGCLGERFGFLRQFNTNISQKTPSFKTPSFVVLTSFRFGVAVCCLYIR